jgi:hypothetical protein
MLRTPKIPSVKSPFSFNFHVVRIKIQCVIESNSTDSNTKPIDRRGKFPALSSDKWHIGALILQEFWHTIHYLSVHVLPNFPVQLFTDYRTCFP